MRIWWCQEHESVGVVLEDPSPDLIRCQTFHYESGTDIPCRMVPMRLIPDNAEYDEQVRERVKAVFRKELLSTHPRLVAAVLAALDGETP